MRRLFSLACALALFGIGSAHGQAFYPDFALVVQLPSYEAFLKNVGATPIRVDGYGLHSTSGSLNPAGWATLDAAGPGIVAALGPGADGFTVVNPTSEHLTELNLFFSATWQPGQSWSIGFPFRSNEPDFILDAKLLFTSPDGLVLTGGTTVPPQTFVSAAVSVIPEPGSATLVGVAALAIAGGARRRRLTGVRKS
jgi:hypothetical protein